MALNVQEDISVANQPDVVPLSVSLTLSGTVRVLASLRDRITHSIIMNIYGL